MKTKRQTYREMLEEAKFPQLYSKRGFKKNRVKVIIPTDRTELAYMKDNQGNKIIMP